MKKNKIVGALALMMLGSSPAFAAENKAADFQASAEVENTCIIEADNVNFGQVSSPLTTQGSSGKLKVLCSQGAPYKIDLAYGNSTGNIVTSGENNVITAYAPNPKYPYDIKIMINGVAATESNPARDITCNATNGLHFLNETAFKWYGHNGIYDPSVTNYPDYKSLCNIRSWSYSANKFNSISSEGNLFKTSDFGVMNGASKGNSLAYKITVPGDTTKVWSMGINSYDSIGSGSQEIIDVNAQIIPDRSSSLYPAQDSYFDTVTAVISY